MSTSCHQNSYTDGLEMSPKEKWRPELSPIREKNNKHSSLNSLPYLSSRNKNIGKRRKYSRHKNAKRTFNTLRTSILNDLPLCSSSSSSNKKRTTNISNNERTWMCVKCSWPNEWTCLNCFLCTAEKSKNVENKLNKNKIDIDLTNDGKDDDHEIQKQNQYNNNNNNNNKRKLSLEEDVYYPSSKRRKIDDSGSKSPSDQYSSLNNAYQNLMNDNTQLVERNKKLKLWLTNDVKLPEYFNLLLLNGFDDIYVCKLLTMDTLTEIGINKIGHRMRILHELKKLKDSSIDKYNNSNVSVSSQKKIIKVNDNLNSFLADNDSVCLKEDDSVVCNTKKRKIELSEDDLPCTKRRKHGNNNDDSTPSSHLYANESSQMSLLDDSGNIYHI